MRKVLFFLAAAAAAGALTPVAPPDFRYVAEVVALTYVVLAALAGLEVLSRR